MYILYFYNLFHILLLLPKFRIRTVCNIHVYPTSRNTPSLWCKCSRVHIFHRIVFSCQG